VVKRRWSAELALVGNAFIWGSTFVVVKSALDDASTLVFLALRFTLAAVALGVAFRPLPSKFAAGPALVRAGMVAGLFLFCGFLCQTLGLRYTTPSKSAFITGLSIVIVPVLAAAVQRKAPRLPEWMGVAIATFGLGLLTLEGPISRVNAGDLLTVGCAIAFAIHILVVGFYVPKFGFQALTLVQVATSAGLAAMFWWVEPVVLRPSAGLLFALVVTALLATALAFSVMTWAQQYTSPTRTALIFALEPVFAWATSFALTGELLSRRATAGALLILAGIVLVELKPFGLKKRPEGVAG
jgi:drug/metabolite transporter (DMT)-like permease